MPRRQSSQWEFENLFASEGKEIPVKSKKAHQPVQPEKPTVLSVGDVTRKIRNLLEGGLRSIHVSGEISNLGLKAPAIVILP